MNFPPRADFEVLFVALLAFAVFVTLLLFFAGDFAVFAAIRISPFGQGVDNPRSLSPQQVSADRLIY
ncbi:MAG: hypothetical protein ACTHQM_25510 [Thermoanaerobaculia bacterium]